VYTSDHGETLQEDGATWPHCHNTRHEALVPLLIITNLKLSPDTSFHASHSNIFATLLDFMQVPEGARLHAYAPSLLSATRAQNQPRFYLDGELAPLPFDQ
jgi:glucan phosphoethanolaminetransferase (alkaline phosphatase superfamily)